MDLYSEEVLDHFRNPHNYGELKEPTVTQTENNPLCGDRIKIQLRIEPSTASARGGQAGQARITKVGFTGEGCAVSTAAASVLTDFVKGKKLLEIETLTSGELLSLLGMEKLTPARMKCALLPLEALRSVLVKYTHLTPVRPFGGAA